MREIKCAVVGRVLSSHTTAQSTQEASCQSGVTRHTCAGIAGSYPDAVAAPRLVAIEKMLKVPAKSGGFELPEPVTMGTSVVLSDCVNEHVLVRHRVVSPANSVRGFLSDSSLGADGASGLE